MKSDYDLFLELLLYEHDIKWRQRLRRMPYCKFRELRLSDESR